MKKTKNFFAIVAVILLLAFAAFASPPTAAVSASNAPNKIEKQNFSFIAGSAAIEFSLYSSKSAVPDSSVDTDLNFQTSLSNYPVSFDQKWKIIGNKTGFYEKNTGLSEISSVPIEISERAFIRKTPGKSKANYKTYDLPPNRRGVSLRKQVAHRKPEIQINLPVDRSQFV